MRASTNSGLRRHLIVSAALLSLSAPNVKTASAAGIVIFTEDKVPRWSQRHDFRNVYNGLASDIPNQAGNGFLTYDQIAADPRTAYHHNAMNVPNGILSANPTAMNTPFVANHYFRAGPPTAGLAGGQFHCAPTATAIWVDWARQTKLKRLDNPGAEKTAIEFFADRMDTNDQNPNLNQGNNQIFIGTRRGDNYNAINSFIQNSSIFYTFTALTYVPFNTEGYHNIINRGHAVRVYYTGPSIGHVVVGLGYDDDTNEAIVVDPDNAGDVRRKLFNQIQPLPGGAAGEGALIGEEPFPPDFAGTWADAEMEILHIPDYQDTPSTFSPLLAPAAHRSTWREWLGPSVSSEVAFTDALDDEDGVANANNMDSHDDGVTLYPALYQAGGSGKVDVQFNTQVLTNETRYDPADPSTWLHLNGWFDWNGDGQFAQDEQVVDWQGGPGIDGLAAGTGLRSLNFSFNVPNLISTEPYWARFRLSRGEDVGPYGGTEFGEVEDYLVPEPAAIWLLVCGVLGLGVAGSKSRRRRSSLGSAITSRG
jgi:GEVED domain